MKTFRAKVGYEILIPVLLLFAGIYVWMVFGDAPQEAFITTSLILIPLVAFTLNVFLQTRYIITDDQKLKIKCGIFPAALVDIQTITTIRKTNSPISSPAPSLDRIEVCYNTYDAVIISPKDKTDFINELKRINPQITTHLS